MRRGKAGKACSVRDLRQRPGGELVVTGGELDCFHVIRALRQRATRTESARQVEEHLTGRRACEGH